MNNIELKNKKINTYLCETILLIRKVDLIYNKNDKKPLLYRYQPVILIVEVIVTAVTGYYSVKALFGHMNPVIRGYIEGITMLIILSILFRATFYFTSKPIIRRMRCLGYKTSDIKFNPFGSEQLNQIWLETIYNKSIKNGFLTGNKEEDQRRIAGYSEGIQKTQGYCHKTRKNEILRVTQMIALFFLITGAFINSLLPSKLLSESEIWEIKEKVLICLMTFILIFLMLYLWDILLKIKNAYLNADFNKEQKVCSILEELRLNLIYGTKETIINYEE